MRSGVTKGGRCYRLPVAYVLASAVISSLAHASDAEPPPAPSGDTPKAEEVCRSLPTQLGAIIAAPAFSGAGLGLHVRNLKTGEELFAHNAEAPLIPASNIKVISTAAALHYLGPDYRFKTEVFVDAGADKSMERLDGPLYVKGGGDPWLVPERLWYLANRIYYQGVRQIRGDIIIDDSFFDGVRLPNGSDQDESSFAYMAPRGALSVGFNTVQVHIYPGKAPGQPARVLLEPRQDHLLVQSKAITTGRRYSRLDVDVVPDGERSIVMVSGKISLYDGPRGYYRRIDNPPLFAGAVLKAQLQSLGINVRGKVRHGVVPEEAEKIAQLASPRLIEIVNRVNKHSNNFMAEQVALTTGAELYGAPATWEKAQKAIDAFLQNEVGLSPGSFAVKNASGLHDVNRVSAKAFVEVLDYMFAQPDLRYEFLSSMSVAASSGTLARRMADTDAAGILRAKTGTLSVASSLSGYVAARRGETLAFSLLVNHYAMPITEIWAAQDEIGVTLATFDSRCPLFPKHHDPANVATISKAAKGGVIHTNTVDPPANPSLE